MTADSHALPSLPAPEIVQQMTNIINSLNSKNVTGAADLRQQAYALLVNNPGLARTDEAFTDEFGISPFICRFASDRGGELARKCLELGSNPMVNNERGMPALASMLVQYAHNPRDTNMLRAIVLALQHPDCARFDQLINHRAMMLDYTAGMESTGRKVFQTVLERTPLPLLREHVHYASLIRRAGNPDFVAKALSDCGVDLERESRNHAPQDRPAHILKDLQKKMLHDILPTVAAVLDEKYFPTNDTASYPPMDYSLLSKQARDILTGEVNRITSGEVTPRQALISARGCASWLAQSLFTRNMLAELFVEKHAALFGGGQQQQQFLGELIERLPPHHQQDDRYMSFLRAIPLSRPDTTATVHYMRGEMPGRPVG